MTACLLRIRNTFNYLLTYLLFQFEQNLIGTFWCQCRQGYEYPRILVLDGVPQTPYIRDSCKYPLLMNSEHRADRSGVRSMPHYIGPVHISP